MSRLIQIVRNRQHVLIAAAFAIVGGSVFLFNTYAATSTIAYEAESGTVNGTTTLDDTTASGGKAVHFGPVTSNSLTVYPAPDVSQQNNTFSVQARNPGGAYQTVVPYDVRVNRNNLSHASFAGFDFAGTVELKIVNNGGPISSARIRPTAAGIVPVISGNTLTFSTSKPGNYSVEINGDIFHNLHVFANPP